MHQGQYPSSGSRRISVCRSDVNSNIKLNLLLAWETGDSGRLSSIKLVGGIRVGKVYESIDGKLADWIKQQHMFFVATAPLKADGLVNCSPKGGDSFRILSPNQVAYQDYTGSGIETVAHLRENRRIVIMFCAFEGPPKIVRLHGHGEVITQQDPGFGELSRHFPNAFGARAYIKIDVTRISDSCGYSVPLYEFRENRDVLDKWAHNRGADGLQEYRDANNLQSIEGLKGLDVGV